jgi:hypothetical protein
MRTHFLKDIPIEGRETILDSLPDFDFYNLRRVTHLGWTAEDDDSSGRANVYFTLVATYQSLRPGLYAIQLRCSDVKKVKLPELGTAFSLSEVEVEDVSTHQLEGVKFRFRDFGPSHLEILCGGIQLSMANSRRAR